ncbi:WbqC family protein [Methylocystis sp. ATCC 49242]|uniref:WbqC family protein n=1 Tax=Methylocystis sp. ATCC 49242 TaxID=622637 RepID=UPI0001F875C1|nr:WbqC family protein [Methylocystis sp. ATCC 49242]
MQPYFFPYAGYFRLFAVCEVFVIYDCVQFPRRGRVHRCQIGGDRERPTWLTLPLERQPRETLIKDLRFSPNAREELRDRVERVAWIKGGSSPAAGLIRELLERPASSVIDYLEDSLRRVAELLAFDIKFIRSSRLAIDPQLRGQDRVIAIASAVGAKRYVNSPGGRRLYDAAAFAEANMELRFLSSYNGPFTNMLHALMTEEPGVIRADIINASTLDVATPQQLR